MILPARAIAAPPPQAAAIECLHCKTTFRSPVASARFCCRGCEAVHALLQDVGLAQYYELRELTPPLCPIPARVSTEDFSFCDDPDVVRRFARNEFEIEFFVEGLQCGACLWLIERLPSLCPDVALADANFATSTVRIVRTPTGSFSRAAQALNRIGYRPHLTDGAAAAARLRDRERRRELVRIGVAGAVAGNIMMFSASLYGGADGALGERFRWLTAVLAAPTLGYCAWPFYVSAWNSLRAKTLNLDVPIVGALLAGTVMSLWALATGADAVYFDSLSVLVFLLLSSRAWLKFLQRRGLDASQLQDAILVGTVDRVRDDGALERVSALSLSPGDRVVIEGDRLVPADGRCLEGFGRVSSAALTGESAPAPIATGAAAFAGARNVVGRWILGVEKPPAESRLAKILRDAEASARSKPKIAQIADSVGKWFVAAVLLLATGVALFFIGSDPAEGFSRALALVIVACPCVFGMAIPLSLSLAVREAAARGIVVKNGDVMERLGAIETVSFDKTGTLTEGRLASSPLDFFGVPAADLAAIEALERGQTHPVARALLDALEEFRLPGLEATGVRPRDGGGLQGFVSGRAYSVVPLEAKLDGAGPVDIQAIYGIFQGDRLLARFPIGDKIRDEAKDALECLRARGLRLELLSGDRATIVAEVGQRLGFGEADVVAEATPEDKALRLRERGASGAMIGDGANDAGALAAAGVGIAVRGSMDASLKSADVYLLRADLRAIDELFQIARIARRAIYRNLAISVSFNLVAGSLALAGRMHPLLAAVLMPASSLTVLLSALASGRRRPRGPA